MSHRHLAPRRAIRAAALTLVLVALGGALRAQPAGTAANDGAMPQPSSQPGMAPPAEAAGQAGQADSRHDRMQAMHQQMMARVEAMDARVDALVASMDAAKGAARVDAVAAVVRELAVQRKELREMMVEGMHAAMGGGMAGPHAMGMQGMHPGMRSGDMHSGDRGPMAHPGMEMGGRTAEGAAPGKAGCCAGHGAGQPGGGAMSCGEHAEGKHAEGQAGCCAGHHGGTEGAGGSGMREGAGCCGGKDKGAAEGMAARCAEAGKGGMDCCAQHAAGKPMACCAGHGEKAGADSQPH